jgi:diguanylate cyclase (GGDEF)-like protein/PAS domain S-box-containing protein
MSSKPSELARQRLVHHSFGLVRVLRFVALFLAGCLASLCAIAQSTSSSANAPEAKPTLRFAVLSFRPATEMMARWNPVAQYLGEMVPSHRIELLPLDYPDLARAVRERKVDLVLTQPAHYVALSVEQQLYSPLATLVETEQGLAMTQFGGVILARTDNPGIQRLSDLRNRRIATSNHESFGGFQVQAFELLELGISLDDLQIIETKTQDGVIAALKDGLADAGFVRTGLLEQMEKEGKLDLSDFKILRAEKTPDFPLILSTRPYPQWALAAMPWLDQLTARQVAGAMLSLPHDGEVAKKAKINGFNIPGEYRSVERVMRALRVPPFEKRVPLLVIWEDRRPIVISLALAILAALGWMLLSALRTRQQRRQNFIALRESEKRFSDFAYAASDWLWEMDAQLRFTFFSERIAESIGTDPALLLGKTRRDLMTPAEAAEKNWLEHLALLDQHLPFKGFEYRMTLPDGQMPFVSISGKPLFDTEGNFTGYRGVGHNISERKQAEAQLRQAATVFDHANEGIVITDTKGKILDVNAAFSAITGYDRSEVLGKNPRFLGSGHQGPEFYFAMWSKLAQEGQWSGELWNRRKDGSLYIEMLNITSVRDPQNQVSLYVGMFHDITTFKEQQHQLEHFAHYDALTQLPNRVLLADRLQQAISQAERRQTEIAVVYLDLDGFKAINDLHGHASGDKLLIELADRMKHALRDGDTLARLGGDEFVAVLLDFKDHTESTPILERLLQLAALPVHVEGKDMRVSASIGVTFFPQADGLDADQLLRQADQAMYVAKQSGKNRYHVFDAAQDRAIRGRHESIERVREALENQEFVLYYQPKINMRSGEVVGAEALIRWQHPEQGLLPPAQFLPLVEDHELIKPIGDWVIQSALRQMESWQEQGLLLPVSVNVAGRQLQAPDFLDKLRIALQEHPGVARMLELEVLESSALDDIARISQLMAACREMGVAFDLDDFGTGYSSLTYLKRLPAQTLKIDQSFVRDMLADPDDLAILDGIIGLAESFQRSTIAEGVETEDHAHMLLLLGCDLGQGYSIARPMPGSDIPSWVAGRKAPDKVPAPKIAREELPVLFAMTEHRAWVKAITLQVSGELAAIPAIDHHQCRFGQWLDRTGSNLYAKHPQLPRVVSLHETIHHRANDLLNQKHQATLQADEVSHGISQIQAISSELLLALEALLKQG